MSENLDLKIRINFPVVLITVLLAHALVITLKSLPFEESIARMKREMDARKHPLNIREIRTVGSKDSKIKDWMIPDVKRGNLPRPIKDAKNISLKDLAAKPTVSKKEVVQTTPQTPAVRPGTNPGVGVERPKALEAIKLKGSQIAQYNSSNAAAISGDPRVKQLDNSDIMVKLEVPEGVTEDELNEYELMFYGFQRRTAIGYINAFYKNLDKFERENPHKQFPLTNDKQTMTGRLTFDEKGNLKQIKMVRWTNVDRLQSFFEDVLKDMDTLHNPPKMLWERNKEFTVFFSLVING